MQDSGLLWRQVRCWSCGWDYSLIFSVNWRHVQWPSFSKGENKGSVLLWYSCFDRSILMFLMHEGLQCLIRLWNDINQLTFVFPFAETRSIKRMWRQLTERMKKKALITGFMFQCLGCTKASLMTGSFFDNTHVPMHKMLGLIYKWVRLLGHGRREYWQNCHCAIVLCSTSLQQCTLHNRNEQFFQVGSGLISLGLALSPPSTSVSSDFMVLCKCLKKLYLLHFTL